MLLEMSMLEIISAVQHSRVEVQSSWNIIASYSITLKSYCKRWHISWINRIVSHFIVPGGE